EQLHRRLGHEQRGVHIGRVHRVHADVVLSQLDREGAHQPDHPVLGGDVVAGVRVGLQPADGAGEDDRPAAAAGEDMRYPGLDRLPHPGEVDVDHVGPVAFAGLVQRLTAVADAGVGDDDVEPAELLDTGVDGRLQGVEIPDVDLGGVDPAVEAFHQVGG